MVGEVEGMKPYWESGGVSIYCADVRQWCEEYEGMEHTRDLHNLSSNASARCGRRVKANRSGVKCECGELRETVQLDTTARNGHPCCKPISLTHHLATLLLPPAAYAPRRLLIPFGGVGSEAIGALLAGWEEIVLVEMSEEYCAIAVKRLEYWLREAQFRTGDVGKVKPSAPAPEGQGSLF